MDIATFNSTIAQARELVAQWGGKIISTGWNETFNSEAFNSEEWAQYERLSHSPFMDGLAVDYEARIAYICEQPLYVEDETDQWRSNLIGGLIHELGHVFACLKDPGHSKEFDFFGWEYVVALKLGVVDAWMQSSVAYQVGDVQNGHYEEFGGMTPEDRAALLRKRVEFAIQNGLVTDDGEPLSIR